MYSKRFTLDGPSANTAPIPSIAQDEAVRFYEVPRWPVAVIVGLPGRAVVVEDDGASDFILDLGL